MRNIFNFFLSPFSREKGNRLRWMRVRVLLGILLSFFLFSCSACSDTKPQTDSDNDSSLSDSDSDLVADYDSPNTDRDTDADVLEVSDTDSDSDTNIECLDLKIWENVEKTPFPFKNSDGKISFCRPECDTPTEIDPQCVRNIWEWLNWGRYQEMLKGNEDVKECYPWPCVLPEEVKSRVFEREPCTRSVSNNYYQAEMATLYDLFIEDGKVGIEMDGSGPAALPAERVMLYDVEKDQYESIGYSGHASTYSKERFIFYTILGSFVDEKEDFYFVLSALHQPDGKWKYEVIYHDEQYRARFSRPPLVNDKWVLLNITHRDQGERQEVLYAKTDDPAFPDAAGSWKWQTLDTPDGKVAEGNIVGNRLALTTFSKELFVCDLDKTPKSLSDCVRIDREGETGYNIRLDEENPDRVVYYGFGKYQMTLVDLSKNPLVYTPLSFTPSEEDSAGGYPEQFRGDMISYYQLYMDSDSQRLDYKSCFYRIDTMKSYCPTTTPDMYGRYDMGYSSFDDKYHLWKMPSGSIAALRDLECYCKSTGMCPFEE